MRPTTLSLGKQQKHTETANFMREAFESWQTRATFNIVPENKVQELFYQVRLYPTDEQVDNMLQTARLFTRRSHTARKQCRGLTFGEFCVLASDFRKFRTSSNSTPLLAQHEDDTSASNPLTRLQQKSFVNAEITVSSDNSEDKTITEPTPTGPEVFLGGSCNPTTWRADVAIPHLNQLGISFYNPQVSQWTPDLIELEHRAKEKARILFFVMDSETRASAGAIEVAHIAGQNLKHLVLVLHPYKIGQKILNETISNEEYLDLSRNQKLLRQLVSRRGLPVLDSIPTALQRIQKILSGELNREPPENVASKLISVRRSYDRIVGKSEFGLTLSQCQTALTSLGYPEQLVTTENLRQILFVLKEIKQTNENLEKVYINFEEYCMVTSYLSILQQEISESSCVSPIKGTNLPPPPIFLSNSPEWLHNQSIKSPVADKTPQLAQQPPQNIYRSHTQPCKNFASSNTNDHFDQVGNRDSGTSSPLPNELFNQQNYRFPSSSVLGNHHQRTPNNSGVRLNVTKSSGSVNIELSSARRSASGNEVDVDESDSNDSVFSTDGCSSGGSSANGDDHTTAPIFPSDEILMNGFNNECVPRIEMRDLYLGGSCMVRTRWRQDIAIPYLKSNNVNYYLPTLHENLCKTHFNSLGDPSVDPSEYCTSLFPGHPAEVDDALMYNPAILDSSRVLLFVITNQTRSLAPMTLAAHCIGLGYNVVLCVQMLPEQCTIGHDKLTPSAVKDYNRGRSYLIDLAKRQEIPCFNEIQPALKCAIDKVRVCKSRNSLKISQIRCKMKEKQSFNFKKKRNIFDNSIINLILAFKLNLNSKSAIYTHVKDFI
uniref:CSON007227 protein n=1 Tax=Culicoides sonorensis TaxID=179676 RepID=A0A336KG08_CULSO